MYTGMLYTYAVSEKCIEGFKTEGGKKKGSVNMSDILFIHGACVPKALKGRRNVTTYMPYLYSECLVNTLLWNYRGFETRVSQRKRCPAAHGNICFLSCHLETKSLISSMYNDQPEVVLTRTSKALFLAIGSS